MKCLFIGVFGDTSTNYSQSEQLVEAGCDVVQYPYREMQNLLSTPGNRDQDIIATIKTEKPDFVLYSKCNGVDAQVIIDTKKITKHILWYMDSMNNFNNELIEKITACNATVCGLQLPYEEAKKYSNNVHFLHEGFDPKVDNPCPQSGDKFIKVSFIGNDDGERKNFIDSYPDVHCYDNVYGNVHADVCSLSMINLNFVRHGAGCSDRVYKIMATKSFLLTQSWKDMEKDFIIGHDLDVFETVEQMKEKIDYYLEHDDEREKIARNGYETVQKFSRANWAKKIMEIANN